MFILRILAIVLFLSSANCSFCQKDVIIPVSQRVIINYADFTVYAEVMSNENKIKPSDDLYYYWFGANDIKRTRGGFAGKLLHGIYSAFYLNKNLREKGEFRYGLKNGEWKSWYMNGEYKERSNWKKGKRHGKVHLFNESGELTEEDNYKNDKLNGKLVKYQNGVKCSVEKYKDGILIAKKDKRSFLRKRGKSPKENKKVIENKKDDKKVIESKKDDKKVIESKKVKPLNEKKIKGKASIEQPVQDEKKVIEEKSVKKKAPSKDTKVKSKKMNQE